MTYYNQLSLAGTITSQVKYYPSPKGNRAIFDIEYIHEGKTQSIHHYHCIAWDSIADEINRNYYYGDNVCVTGSILNNNYKDPNTGKYEHYMQVWVNSIKKIEG